VLGRRWVHEAVGADFLCSVVYGMQTVLFVLVARNAGLGMHGYGYLFAAIGAGGLVGTSLAGRVARLPLRVALAASLAMVGVPMLALPLAHWAPAALVLAGFTGAGAICVEVMTETGLQRMLDDEVFGQTTALLACGGVVIAYCVVIWRSSQSESPAVVPRPIGQPTVPQPAWRPIGQPTVQVEVLVPVGESALR
jgi:hypothetical protein